MPSPFPNPSVTSKGKVHCLEIDSQLLRGNPWNDPHQRELWVYTPVNYDSEKSYHWLFFGDRKH